MRLRVKGGLHEKEIFVKLVHWKGEISYLRDLKFSEDIHYLSYGWGWVGGGRQRKGEGKC